MEAAEYYATGADQAAMVTRVTRHDATGADEPTSSNTTGGTGRAGATTAIESCWRPAPA